MVETDNGHMDKILTDSKWKSMNELINDQYLQGTDSNIITKRNHLFSETSRKYLLRKHYNNDDLTTSGENFASTNVRSCQINITDKILQKTVNVVTVSLYLDEDNHLCFVGDDIPINENESDKTNVSTDSTSNIENDEAIEDLMFESLDQLFSNPEIMSEIEDLGLETTYNENFELLQEFHNNQSRKVKERLIINNLKLVKKIASKYEFLVTTSYSKEDIFQDGVLGFMKAIDKFDVSCGFSLSTYAWYWIRQSILRGIQDNANLIRVPVHKQEEINRFMKTIQNFPETDSYQDIINNMNLTSDQLNEILRVQNLFIPKSIDSPVSNESEELKLGDVLVDDSIPSVEDTVQSHDFREKLLEVLNTCLKPKEAKVIRLRYGIDDGKYRTLEEVGGIFGVTRERIRQIEARALLKLRRKMRKEDYFLEC